MYLNNFLVFGQLCNTFMILIVNTTAIISIIIITVTAIFIVIIIIISALVAQGPR